MLRAITPGLLLLLLWVQSPSVQAGIIPQPVQVIPEAGQLLLPTPVSLQLRSDVLAPEGQLLAQYLQGLGLETTDPVNAVPGVTLGLDASLGASAYRLRIDHRGVDLIGGDAAGVFLGSQSLRQLLAQAEHTVEGLVLARQEIVDRPQFPYRGMHLDVSRHFFDVAFIKRYIDLLALHKMNVFHWHLTDDQGWRLHSRAFPRLTDVGAWRSGTVQGHTHDAGADSDGTAYGGFYTWEEVREVVAYAAARHIMVIPEIDVPGHASAMIAAYPELGCGSAPAKVQTHFGVFPDILCPRERTFEFLKALLQEVAELFPGPYIHIGGDEVRKDRWQACAECIALMQTEDLEDFAQLQAWFVNRTEGIVHALGKRIIGWDEILDGDIRASAIVMSWRGEEGGIRAAQAGHDVIMTPLQHVYFDFYQGSSVDEPMAIHGLTRLQDVYAFKPVPEELTAEERAHILGGQANLWTEYVTDEETAERMVLPRMTALAEVLWTPPAQHDFADFGRRLPAFEAQLVDMGYRPADSHYKPHIVATMEVDGSYTVRLESLAADIRYALDGKRSGTNAVVYREPFAVRDSAQIRAWSIDEDGRSFGDARLTVENHLAREASVQAADGTEPLAPARAAVLIDGLIASDRIFRYPEWYSFGEQGMDLVLEFPADTRVSEVSIGVDAGFHRRLFPPTSFAVQMISDDGEWKTLAELHGDAIAAAGKRLALKFTPVTVSRIRVIASSDQQHWSEEQSKYVPSTISVDEIIVR